MDTRKKTLRVSIAALLFALTIRFCIPSLTGPVLEFLTRPETVACLLYAETGRRVRLSPQGEVLQEQVRDGGLPYVKESSGPEIPEDYVPVFSDAEAIEMDYGCTYRPDLSLLLKEPLRWNLKGQVPRVLIYHSHTTESYRKIRNTYEETAPYRTLDPQYNIVSIGDRVAELLEAEGIPVLHDREVHDYPDYNSSYFQSRLAVKKLLKENEELVLVLDLHRDAIEGPEGQMKTTANLGGRTAAQLMIVVGTNCRAKHSGWPRNLSLALKLQAQLENQTPGIVRPLNLRPQRFNQDLSPGALLIEVGAAGNTQEEALLAAEELARAIIALAGGTATIESGETDSAPPSEPAADF